MTSKTSQTVVETDQAPTSGSEGEGDDVDQIMDTAEMHPVVQVRLAACRKLRETDTQAADRNLSCLLSSVRRRTGNLHAWSFGWAVVSVIAIAAGLAISDAFSEPARLLTFGVLVLVFKMIKVSFDQWRRHRSAHAEMQEILDTLGREDPVGLVPLLPELRRVAAFRSGQELPLRREATILVKRIETALHEQGSFPLPAASIPHDERELPLPAASAPSEHPTPNTQHTNT